VTLAKERGPTSCEHEVRPRARLKELTDLDEPGSDALGGRGQVVARVPWLGAAELVEGPVARRGVHVDRRDPERDGARERHERLDDLSDATDHRTSADAAERDVRWSDRKSTRLNSSH